MDDQNMTIVKKTVEKFEQIAKKYNEDTVKASNNLLKEDNLKRNPKIIKEKSQRSIVEQSHNCSNKDKTEEDFDKTETIRCLLTVVTILGLYICILIFLHIRSVESEKTMVIRKNQEIIKVLEENSIIPARFVFSAKRKLCSFPKQVFEGVEKLKIKFLKINWHKPPSFFI